MGKIYFLLIVVFISGSVKSQVALEQVDSLIIDAKAKVNKIDSEVLYKVDLESYGYIGEDNIWLYFDSQGVLKKSKFVLIEDDYESCWIYYDSTQVAFYTSYYAWSMTGAYSIERYLDDSGNLLYLNHVGKQELQSLNSIEPFMQEQIIRRSPNSLIPSTDYLIYDNVLSIDSLNKVFVDAFNVDTIKLSGKISNLQESQAIKFVAPSKGDTVSLNQNDVFIYQKPSLDSRVKDKIHICRNIVILDKIREWYKISLTNSWLVKIEGYIHKDFLAPVERKIK